MRKCSTKSIRRYLKNNIYHLNPLLNNSSLFNDINIPKFIIPLQLIILYVKIKN
jgi:hypothetical protein